MPRKRLYFLLPDVECCKRVVSELKEQGLTDHDIHVVARDDIPLDGMHRASMLQKTELGHGLELGVGVGGFAGMLGGLLAVTFPPAGVVLGGGALVLAATLAGAGFGSIVSALVASDIPNHELENFQSAVNYGQILVLVDVPSRQLDAFSTLVRTHHPEAKISITKPTSAPKPAAR